MGKSGRHPEKALTAVKINALNEPGKHADGHGLYLIVDDAGRKRWVSRLVIHGKRHDIGLGSYPLVTLAVAREQAMDLRRCARAGGDPIEKRRAEKRVVPNFADFSQVVFSELKPSWKNPKHADQWLTTLKTYAWPIIGQLRVNRITTADLLQVLMPIWLKIPETARRVMQRVSTVLDHAKAKGFRTGENPVPEASIGLPAQLKIKGHHSALPYSDVNAFIQWLENAPMGTSAKLAFKFLILTAGRTSEILNARWSEIDLEKALWTVPASRMKAKVEHRVPLSSSCLSILRSARDLDTGSGFIFPGRDGQKALSNMALLEILKRGEWKVTAHGFRSSFRVWASEMTQYSHDACERALAHTIKNQIEKAYNRTDLLEQRRNMMEDWDAFISGTIKQSTS